MSTDEGLVVVAGAGGFIGGHLTRFFASDPLRRIRAVDRKPLSEWQSVVPGVESFSLDLSDEADCQLACAGAAEVYNLAADMGGMGFIELHRVECLRSSLINLHLIQAAYEAGVRRYFYASSACVYNTELQARTHARGLKESDAYPALAERGYGWEKLFGEIVCQEYWHERGLKTFIARLHNVYGPRGAWIGGREKAPAALCRKVVEAVETGGSEIEVWGDGEQTRTFTYVDDCVTGIDLITHHDPLIATPVNLGSTELVSINTLLSKIERIAGVTLKRRLALSAPRGVAGRSPDNTLIRFELGWEPRTTLDAGLAQTYAWIRDQYLTLARTT